MSGEPTPEIARFRDALVEGYAAFPELAEADMPRRREIAGLVRARWAEGGPVMVERRDFHAQTRHGPVRLRLLRPEGVGQDAPALLYCHGGGFVTFSLDTHDRLMREYAARAGIAVIGIDYALSPEVRWPVALEQVVDASAALRTDGWDVLAFGGDSAGANLALSAALAIRDGGGRKDGGRQADALLLNYGFFGEDYDMPSQARFGGPDELLTTDELRGFLRDYLDGTAGWQSPLALPALAQVHDLPPSFHAIAECDPLADAACAMAQRMRGAGNAVEAMMYAGACHSFLEAVSISPLADRALDEASAWLRSVLG